MNIFPIAFNTFKETVRDKVLYVILLFSVFIISASLILSKLSLGQNDRIIVDLGLASISLFGVLLTLFIGANLLNKEIDKKTIYLLLSKPMGRYEFILGKHLGLSMTLFIIITFMSLAFYGLIFITTEKVSFVYLQAIFLIYVELMLLVSIAILFSTIAPPVMSSIYTLAVYIIGHFTKDLLHFGTMSQNETMALFTRTIYYVLPDLEKLNIKNLVLYSPDGVIPEIFTGGILYGILYTFIALTISIFIFEFKEF